MPGRSRQRKQNTLLQWHRVQRGWSRAELARQVNQSIAAENDSDRVAVVDEDHVKSWEIRHGTHKDYAKHLCLIFGLPASELGLLSDEELALRPCALPVPSGLSGMVDCRQSVQGRREVMAMTSSKPNLQWALALRAAGVPLDADQEEVLVGSRRQPVVSRTDPRAVESYTAIVGHQRALYWTTPPGTLLGAASAHLGLGVDMLQDDPADNPALASAVAECALLVARLSFFDLDGHDDVAGAAFRAAEASVARAQDHALAIAVAAHQAFVPGFDRRLADARPYLVAAERQWRRSARSPLVRSWLHCVSAEICARCGENKESRYHIRQAQEYLGRTEGTAPLWLDFFDSSRLAGFAGNAALLASRHADAVHWLQQALDDLGTNGGKQRSVLLLDLAAAHAATEPERALDLAIEACDCLERDYYQTAVERIPHVRAALSGSRSASRLTERAQLLVTSAPQGRI